MMKKGLLLIFLMIFTFTSGIVKESNAEIISYPFDSITIVEAYTFDVIVPSDITTNSLLYSVTTEGETLTIYVGVLEFVLDGEISSGSSTVLIVSNELGEDLFQFLVNNYSYNEGVKTTWGYASHILIDPEVGVYKDFTVLEDGFQELGIIHDLVLDTWTFVDNEGIQIPQIAGTYFSETGLDIVISAYSGGGA